MKALKIITGVFAAVLVLASCKSNMDLTKRHYTKGYYFHKSKTLDQPKTTEEVAVNKNKAADLKLRNAELTKKSEESVKGELKETNQPVVLNSMQKAEKKEKASAGKSISTYISAKKATSAIQQKNKKQSSSAKGGDANTILLVILCLFPFINLIPVYIHDGKSVTTNFWLTLLLDILFFLPGIIFAILVVLDVVNLA